MKLSSIGLRRLVLGLLGLGLVAAMAFVVMRSGPLAPTRVTVMKAAEGRLYTGTLRHRHGRGPTQLPDRAHGRRSGSFGDRRRGRPR